VLINGREREYEAWMEGGVVEGDREKRRVGNTRGVEEGQNAQWVGKFHIITFKLQPGRPVCSLLNGNHFKH